MGLAAGHRPRGKSYFDQGDRDIIFAALRRGGRGVGQPGQEVFVLNRFDPHSPSAGEAEVKYLDGDFRVIRPGAFVRCAVTGTMIPLEELKYWSVERQEAYAGPEAVLRRLHPVRSGLSLPTK
jgi:hypothetical protein